MPSRRVSVQVALVAAVATALQVAVFLLSGSAPAASQVSIVRNGQGWTCSGPVDLDLVKVTNPPGDAIVLAAGCTGVIRRIEVDTRSTDGIKVQNARNVAHDITIGGGYVKCQARLPQAHQDGIQAMGGRNITFRNLYISCLGHSQFFVNRGGSGASTPTGVVCDNCRLDDTSGDPSSVINARDSGLRNTVACRSQRRNAGFEWGTSSQLVGRVDVGNTLLPRGSAGCKGEPS